MKNNSPITKVISTEKFESFLIAANVLREPCMKVVRLSRRKGRGEECMGYQI